MLDDTSVSEVRASLLDSPPQEAVAVLYGPSWRRFTSSDRLGFGWFRSYPPPVRLAPIFADLLRGRFFHDGRSARNDRGYGWWRRADDGSFESALPTELSSELLFFFEDVTAAAERVSGKDERWRSNALGKAMELCGLGTASAFFNQALAALRADVSMRLPPEAVEAIAVEWMSFAVDRFGWVPGSEVPAAVLMEAYKGGASDALPHRVFIGGLWSAGLARRRASGVVYRVPCSPHDHAAPPA